jgi:hypothetical protein
MLVPVARQWHITALPICHSLQMMTKYCILVTENDTPAFKKADTSIGIRSDDRIKTALECKHYLRHENLALLLNRPTNNDFNSGEDLLSLMRWQEVD